MQKVFFNGEFMHYGEVNISPEDRGFNFADGLYEVIRVYNGRPFCMREHLDRLYSGAEELEISIPYSRTDFADITDRLLQSNDLQEAMIYMQVTRGAAPRSHPFPDSCEPTVFVFVRSVSPPAREKVDRGVSVITQPDNRWGLCHIKTIGLLPNCIARTKAERQGAFEALLVRDGFVTEATARTAFCVRDDVMYTHPLANILPSVTRLCVLRLAEENGWPVQEQALPVAQFLGADEIFIGGTVAEILPVVRADGREVGDGKPGPIFRSVYRAYQELIDHQCER